MCLPSNVGVCAAAADPRTECYSVPDRAVDMRGDDILLLLLLVGTLGLFATANFDLRRSAVDEA